jgi:DNA-binding MarR family transcriptional regulator
MIALIVQAHRMLHHRLDADLYQTPAWDMLLDLYVRERRQPISLTSLGGATAVSPSSALRTIDVLVERNLLVRVPDPHDRRRINVRLSARAIRLLNRYFDDLARLLRKP